MSNSAFSRVKMNTLHEVIDAIDLVITDAHGEEQTADLHVDYVAIAMFEFLRIALEETSPARKKQFHKNLIRNLKTMSEVHCAV